MSCVFKERKERFKELNLLNAKECESVPSQEINIPEGVFEKCSFCQEKNLKEDIADYSYVCPHCQNHFRLRASECLQIVVDKDSFREVMEDKKSSNPLEVPGYTEKLKENRTKNKINEAVMTGFGKIKGYKYAIAVMDSHFIMGSMGTVVGEKITFLIELATKKGLPLIIFCASGGARMQEGVFSLMQLAKITAAIGRHHKAGLLYIPVLTHPTTGGVSCFAMLGDIIIAEPNALIGFSGPRVIEQTIKERLPEGFQSSESLIERGFIDMIVNRQELKDTIGKLSKLHGIEVEA